MILRPARSRRQRSLACRALRAIPDKVVEKAIAKEPRLNEGQVAAVRTVCRAGGLSLVEGPPGSGKSSMLRPVRIAIEAEGGNVIIGLTPSNRARASWRKAPGSRAIPSTDSFMTKNVPWPAPPSTTAKC